MAQENFETLPECIIKDRQAAKTISLRMHFFGITVVIWAFILYNTDFLSGKNIQLLNYGECIHRTRVGIRDVAVAVCGMFCVEINLDKTIVLSSITSAM